MRREILFKRKESTDFLRYVDIGACDKNYDSMPLFDDERNSYIDWYLAFKSFVLGKQILILHYYLLQYNSGELIPSELRKRISNELDYFNDFNKKWFDPNIPLFNSLDLNWEDIDNEILTSKENKSGTRTEIEFKDGSIIRFLDSDDTVKSFYVTPKEYSELESEMNLIIERLK